MQTAPSSHLCRAAVIFALVGSVGGCGSEASSPATADSGPGSDGALVDGGRSGDDGTEVETAVPHDEKFSSAYAHAFCDAYDGCCTAGAGTEDHDACLTKVTSFIGPYVDGAEARGATIDWTRMPACEAFLRDSVVACGDGNVETIGTSLTFDEPRWSLKFHLACTTAIQGPKALGEPCTIDFDCVQPVTIGGYTTCVSESGSSHCQQRLYGHAGDACDPSDTTGLNVVHECDFTASDDLRCYHAAKRCAAAGILGEACEYGTCASGYTCGSDGKCAALPKAGDACTFSADCVHGTRCTGSPQKCVPYLSLGASCTSTDECQSGSCVAGRCAPHDVSWGRGAASTCN